MVQEKLSEILSRLRELKARYQGRREVAAVLAIFLVGFLAIGLAYYLPNFRARFDSKAAPSCQSVGGKCVKGAEFISCQRAGRIKFSYWCPVGGGVCCLPAAQPTATPSPTPGLTPTSTPIPPSLTPSPIPANMIVIHPGESIQATVDANSPGTTFLIKSGVHRLQSVIPKDNDSFIGENGAVMSGAKVLDNLVTEGNYWVAIGQTQQGQIHGECERDYPGCKYPEDLFIDDVPLQHVLTLDDVGPGKWYFDYDADKIYFVDSPANRKVEVGVTRHAFDGDATDVVIQGLIIEKYANPAQHGAIHGLKGTAGVPGTTLSRSWIVKNNEIRLNHGTGLRLSNQMEVLGNYIHHNGQLGIGGGGDEIVVENNEITDNNFAGFDSGWEAGGTKFVLTKNLIVRGNIVHHNKGPGLWTDIDNIDSLYTNNLVFDNDGMGIFHEISYKATIHNNTVRGNGKKWFTWLYGAQILISSSRDTEIFDNNVTVEPNSNGVGLIQQDRGEGAYGPHTTINNHVHNNQVTYLSDSGFSGAAADYQPEVMLGDNNRFDYNIYHVPNLNSRRWKWQDDKSWSEFQATGQEQHGSVDTNIASDVTVPSVSILSPVNGSDVSGSVTVSATATDNQGIALIRFFLNGELTGRSLGFCLRTNNCSVSWNTSTMTDGIHTIQTVVIDISGNQKETITTVAVNNQTQVSTPTPTLSPTETPTLTPSLTPTPTLRPTSTPRPSPTPTPKPKPWWCFLAPRNPQCQ